MQIQWWFVSMMCDEKDVMMIHILREYVSSESMCLWLYRASEWEPSQKLQRRRPQHLVGVIHEIWSFLAFVPWHLMFACWSYLHRWYLRGTISASRSRERSMSDLRLLCPECGGWGSHIRTWWRINACKNIGATMNESRCMKTLAQFCRYGTFTLGV